MGLKTVRKRQREEVTWIISAKESMIACNLRWRLEYREITFSLATLISQNVILTVKKNKNQWCQPAVHRLLLGSGKMLINQSSALWDTGQWPLCSTGWRSHTFQPWSTCCPCSLLIGPDPTGSTWQKKLRKLFNVNCTQVPRTPSRQNNVHNLITKSEYTCIIFTYYFSIWNQLKTKLHIIM